jgi:hypothetical protein
MIGSNAAERNHEHNQSTPARHSSTLDSFVGRSVHHLRLRWSHRKHERQRPDRARSVIRRCGNRHKRGAPCAIQPVRPTPASPLRVSAASPNRVQAFVRFLGDIMKVKVEIEQRTMANGYRTKEALKPCPYPSKYFPKGGVSPRQPDPPPPKVGSMACHRCKHCKSWTDEIVYCAAGDKNRKSNS